MSLEKPSAQKERNDFHESFPHLKHHNLTPEEQERFLVLHRENEEREAADKLTHDQLLEHLSRPISKYVPPQETSVVPVTSLEHVGPENIKQATRSTRKKVVTNVVDFVPVIGSAKMILEGIQGKQLGTEKEIKGLGRVVHTVSGAAFLALDLTGVGAIASEIGKGGLKVGERIIARRLEKLSTGAVEQTSKKSLDRVSVDAAAQTVEKEGAKLVVRGEERANKQAKIAESEGMA